MDRTSDKTIDRIRWVPPDRTVDRTSDRTMDRTSGTPYEQTSKLKTLPSRNLWLEAVITEINI